MTACKETERSLNRVLAGLVVAVAVVMGALTHVFVSIQPMV